MSIYLELFESREDIEKQYGIKLDEDIEILLAWYKYEDYSGQSLVVYRQHGKLYEVNAYHCSCYGLEDCWSPEETTVEALRMRKISSEYDGGLAQRELSEFLDTLEA